MWGHFESVKPILANQFKEIEWEENSGLNLLNLKENCLVLAQEAMPKCIKKARIIAYILDNAQLGVTPYDLFSESINHGRIMESIRADWKAEAFSHVISSQAQHELMGEQWLAYTADEDFGHVAPDWESILMLGIPGLLDRVTDTRARMISTNQLTENQYLFYESCIIVYEAVIRFLKRMSKDVRRYVSSHENMRVVASNLEALSARAPQTLHEALQLILVFYFVQTEIECDNVRSLGMLDRLLFKFYKQDIETGIATPAQEKELLKYFMYRFYSANVLSNIPFGLGGSDHTGKDQTNDLTYVILEAYSEISVPSPKIHFLCTKDTPNKLKEHALRIIKSGNNSIVFANSEVIAKALVKIGISIEDARNHLLVGCYEPAVIGKEIPCSCNGRINLAKALEYTLFNGYDVKAGHFFSTSADTIDYSSFDELYDAFVAYVNDFAGIVMKKITAFEKCYPEVNPAPLLSATLADCIYNGIDAYNGGAQYNNSSINAFGLATAADSLYVIKKLVFDEKKYSLRDLLTILLENWAGYDALHTECCNSYAKYGNNQEEVDALTAKIVSDVAPIINGKTNGRGGVFRCGFFSIDWRMEFGKRMGASADGRFAGEPLSKNIGASVAADKNGVTAHILSATKIDYSVIPNGTALDLVFHSSAVSGEDGLKAMLAILNVFLSRGGMVMQCNIFNPEILLDAQRNPEKYSTLQVRLCGWNVYFVDLTKIEQDEFIKQAKNS